jgi:phosphoribosylformylglycinamidine synthase
MGMSSGIGARLSGAPQDVPAHAFWFGEDQGRYLATTPQKSADAIIRAAERDGVVIARLGVTGGDALTLPDERSILVSVLSERFEGWLPAYMASGRSDPISLDGRGYHGDGREGD